MSFSDSGLVKFFKNKIPDYSRPLPQFSRLKIRSVIVSEQTEVLEKTVSIACVNVACYIVLKVVLMNAETLEMLLKFRISISLENYFSRIEVEKNPVFFQTFALICTLFPHFPEDIWISKLFPVFHTLYKSW